MMKYEHGSMGGMHTERSNHANTPTIKEVREGYGKSATTNPGGDSYPMGGSKDMKKVKGSSHY